MQSMYYIGLDVHKQKISYCVKDSSGKIHAEGWIPATRFDLDRWRKTLPQPWSAAMEATMFSGWIYDQLKPHAAALKVAHPLMLHGSDGHPRTTTHAALSQPAGASDGADEDQDQPLLMEAGVSYNKQKLHKAGFFRELLTTNPDIDCRKKRIGRPERGDWGEVGSGDRREKRRDYLPLGKDKYVCGFT